MEKWVCDVCGYIYDPEIGDPDNGIAALLLQIYRKIGFVPCAVLAKTSSVNNK